MKYVLFYTLIIATFAKEQIEDRIKNLKYQCTSQENNTVINDYNYPWVTYIPLETRTYNPGANVQCIGALISKRYVITPSTCLQFVVSKVHLGRGGMVDDMLEIPVQKWKTYDNADVALFKLDRDVQFTDAVRPICLPFKEFKKAKTPFHVTSWTLDSKLEPFSVNKKIMRGRLIKCQKSSKYFKCLRSTGADVACYGDEGSPVAYLKNENWILYGLLYNVFDDDGTPCAYNSPAVALKITDDIVDWIVKNIDE